MKYEKINAAFDAMSPTAEQTWRMRENLMEKLPKDRPQKRERPMYTQRCQEPKRRRGWMASLTAALALALAAGLFVGTRTAPQEVQTAPVETLKTADGPLCQAYYEVLKTHMSAISQNWTAEKCEIWKINTAVADMDSLDELGYALLDLNYDGVDELLITGPQEHYLYNVNGIYGIYTRDSQGKAVRVELYSGNRANVEVLCKDRVIQFPRSINPNSKEDRAFDFYRLENTKLVNFDYIRYAPARNPENPWFRGNQGKGTRDQETITEAEYNAVLASHEVVAFDYYPIEDALHPAKQEAADFQTILDRYRAGVYEGWNDGICQANQISGVVHDVSHERELAYCLRDVDGDGVEDLLITNADGSELYSVHIQKDGKVEMHPFLRWETYKRLPYVLMDDNTLYQKRDDIHCFIVPETMTIRWMTQEGEGADAKWYAYSSSLDETDADGEEDPSSRIGKEEITKAEVMKRINSYTPAKLEVSPLASILGENYAQNFTLLLERYATAVREGWNVEKCQGGMLCVYAAQCRYPWELGYAMYDLDGDGTEELLITDGSGSRIYSAYAQKENRVEMLPFFQFSETSLTPRSYVLMADGTLALVLGEDHYNFYRLDTMTSRYLQDFGKDGKHDWQLQEGDMQFVTDYLQNQNIPDSVGMVDEPADTEKPQWKRLTDAQAEKLISACKPGALAVQPLPGSDTEFASYQEILDRHLAAVQEGWDMDKCSKAQVTTAAEVTDAEELGYVLRDVDGDGEAELLITSADGGSLYEIYTKKNGRIVKSHWTPKEDPFILMEGDVLQAHHFEDSYAFWNLSTNAYTEVWSYTESPRPGVENQKWARRNTVAFRNTEEDQLPGEEITEAEYRRLIEAHKPLKLEPNPLTEPVGE